MKITTYAILTQVKNNDKVEYQTYGLETTNKKHAMQELYYAFCDFENEYKNKNAKYTIELWEIVYEDQKQIGQYLLNSLENYTSDKE